MKNAEEHMNHTYRLGIAGFFLALMAIAQHRGFMVAMIIAFVTGFAFFIPAEQMPKKLTSKQIRMALVALSILSVATFIIEANLS